MATEAAERAGLTKGADRQSKGRRRTARPRRRNTGPLFAHGMRGIGFGGRVTKQQGKRWCRSSWKQER
eukprot:9931745-Heterocapsa_arctica.AAC.1